MGFLKLDQLAEERVVFGVGDLGRVLLVVEPRGTVDLGAQLGNPGGNVSRPRPRIGAVLLWRRAYWSRGGNNRSASPNAYGKSSSPGCPAASTASVSGPIAPLSVAQKPPTLNSSPISSTRIRNACVHSGSGASVPPQMTRPEKGLLPWISPVSLRGGSEWSVART